MRIKKPVDKTKTPDAVIKGELRRLFVRSRERATALQRDHYSCTVCGIKQSKAKGKEVKVCVHHKTNILNWKELFEAIRKYLLVAPEHLATLCKECHSKETEKENKNVGN